MAADDGPVTKADLYGAIGSIQKLIENELRHQSEDIAALRDWRDQFVVEGGPWRTMDRRVSALEYLARSVKVVIVTLTPIAVWAIIEIIKVVVAWARGGP